MLHLFNQYMHDTYGLRFTAKYCVQEQELLAKPTALDEKAFPTLVQMLGGWDLYCKGKIYHTRTAARALVAWCHCVASAPYNGRLARDSLALHSMLVQICGGVG